MQGILPPVPCCHSRRVCWACPGRSQPMGSWPERRCYYNMEALPSSTICPSSLPAASRALPTDGLWRPREDKALEAAPWELAEGSSTPVQTGWKGDPYKGHGFSPVTLVSQLRWLEAALGHEHQGPAEAQGQESRVSRAFGVRQRASVRPTSWGAGGIKGAAARQARWQ